jgi:hypothetical protein
MSFFFGGFIYGALFRPPYLNFQVRVTTALMWGVLWPVISGGLEVQRGSAWPIVLIMWIMLFFTWRYIEYRSYFKRHLKE